MTSDAKARVKKNAWLAMNTLQYAPDRIESVYRRGDFPEEIRDGLKWAMYRILAIKWNVEALQSGDEEAILDRGGWAIATASALDLFDGMRAMLRGYLSPPHQWQVASEKEKLAEALLAIDMAYKPFLRLYHTVHRYHPPRSWGLPD